MPQRSHSHCVRAWPLSRWEALLQQAPSAGAQPVPRPPTRPSREPCVREHWEAGSLLDELKELVEAHARGVARHAGAREGVKGRVDEPVVLPQHVGHLDDFARLLDVHSLGRGHKASSDCDPWGLGLQVVAS